MIKERLLHEAEQNIDDPEYDPDDQQYASQHDSPLLYTERSNYHRAE